MPQPSQTDGLQQAIAITDDILARLNIKDLEPVQQLYEQREALIKAVFAQPVQAEHAPLIERLRDKNDTVVAQLETVRQAVFEQQKKASHANQATRAYQSNQG